MRYLLDTGVWIWTVGVSSRLSEKATKLIEDGTHEIYFSAASSWEICIKAASGKLRLPEPPDNFIPDRLTAQGIYNLSITNSHALGVYSLPRYHDDPFDRLLIAQARTEKMTILTVDRVFAKYDVDIFWCGH
jgi:PIN domain nuclease of toxin-antitoxin system